jgi:uncharacterized protein YbbC (DUF1343 family)
VVAIIATTAMAACVRAPHAQPERPSERVVRPGITVLLEDSLELIAGKRIALLTNQTGVDATGASDVELLQRDPRAVAAGVTLVRLFSPEHGIRGTADRPDLPDEVDRRSGLTVHSLYTRESVPPPDSLLGDLDALVFDLQDIGTRTWTYVGVMVYAMRAAARAGIPFIVLDRPNPLGGRAEGPLLDSALANPRDPTAAHRGQAYALYPAPLRHGMTMGELARLFAGELGIGVRLHVIPAAGWRRSMWWEETGLPWVVPSPAMVSTTSALLYPALVPFEGTNLSVGRGTALPFQRIGAPWLDAEALVRLLDGRLLAGVRFEAERFTPVAPTDGKFAGRELPGVRIIVDDRSRVQVGRLAATLLWAVMRSAPDSLRLTPRSVDLRFGASAAREALQGDADPDEVIDRMQPDVAAWQWAMRRYQLYR